MQVLTFGSWVDATGKHLSIVLVSTPFEFPLIARRHHLTALAYMVPDACVSHERERYGLIRQQARIRNFMNIYCLS